MFVLDLPLPSQMNIRKRERKVTVTQKKDYIIVQCKHTKFSSKFNIFDECKLFFDECTKTGDERFEI